MPSQIADGSTGGNSAGDILLKPSGVEVVAVNNANEDGESSQMLRDENRPSLSAGLLETASQRKARKRSHYVVYVTTFVMSIGFSIVLTGVWPYLQQLDPTVSKEFLGWVVAANPLGQMLASPVLGIWANRSGSNRGAFIVTIFFFILGNALYSILSLFGYAASGLMIFSRFVVGVSSANVAIIRSYVAASTTMAERTTAVSLISASQGLGFIIGPAIQAALAMAFAQGEAATNSTNNETISLELEDNVPQIEWDMYTATGWVAALLGLLNIFLFIPCIFQEHPIAAKEAQLQKRAANGRELNIPKPDYWMLIVILITFFVILTIYVLLETLMVPMTMDLYAWSDEKAITIIGIGLSIAGLLTVFMFSSVGIMSRKFDERKILIFVGLIPLLLSVVCFFPMGSTYPKIQNCTVDDDSGDLHSGDVAATSQFSSDIVIPTTVLPDFMESSKSPEKIPSKLDADSLANNVVIFSTETPDSPLNEDIKSHSNHTLHSRRRRHTTRNEKCQDLGCPSEQSWCYYTPIIEIPQLGVACFIAITGYPVAFALCSALFSKLLGPKPQGFWMGILTSTGSFSRVVGPISVSYVYTTLGTRWTFGLLFVILAVSLLLVSVSFKRLVPMKVTENSSSKS